MGKIHDLKILKEYFDAKLAGIKPFEIRKNDRDFQVGDYLRLREIVPIPNTLPVMYDYTGRVLITEVVYILHGVGLQDDYVALGERPEDYLENDYLPGTVKHVVNLSGGKDSTAMLLMMLEDKKPIDYIIFADTGKDFPQMRDHLTKLAEYIKQHYPEAPEITVLRSEKTFDYLMFDHIKIRGKNKGKKGYGWASMIARWCTAELKTRVIEDFIKSLGEKCVQYIGIAADEPERLRKIPNMVYPLNERGITEAAALQYCYERGFDWGGLYNYFDRVSCWCCPLKNQKELKNLYMHSPELWAELKEMDKKAFNQFKHSYSVQQLEEKFAREVALEGGGNG